MDRGVEKIADLVLIAAMLTMFVLVMRVFWRGYRGLPIRASRTVLVAGSICAAVGIAAAAVILVV